jgi:spermidine dehydrogenase
MQKSTGKPVLKHGRKRSMTALSKASNSGFSAGERELGMNCNITRRDFVNAMVAGTGLALLGNAAPGVSKDTSARAPPEPWHPWTGYGGVGDYAISNGNTWDVVNAGHGIRDTLYERSIADAAPTGEVYDLGIVGGGFSGVMAAYTFLKDTKRERPCLLLDNHPILGGEAKRNEFLVRGQRLIGPQGSNETFVPTTGWLSELWSDIGLPTKLEFAQLSSGRRPMEVPLNNYDYLFWDYESDNKHNNHGYFFDTPRPHWVTNPWAHRLEGTPWPQAVRRDLLRWRDESVQPFSGDETSLERWLDTMTYDDYLTKVRRLHPEVARYADPLFASVSGPSTDGASACFAYRMHFPGFQGLSKTWDEYTRAYYEGRRRALEKNDPRQGFSFPGGNDGIMRALVKRLTPEAIEGTTSFADVHNGRIRFGQMDREHTPCRMRAGATVVRVVHDPERTAKGKPATITYVKEGKLFSVQARTVIWAGSSWTAKHVVQHLPDEYRAAMESFPRSPMLVVNVALDNWRALYKLGYTACSWRGGFGFTANIRAPMYVGEYRPPLDPDQPTVFTFYVPFPQPGLPLAEQGKVARAKMFATNYREFETQIRRQLVKLFSSAGFDPKRDIAGIVLNRWGHAYVNAGPGFCYGHDGKSSPSDVLRRPLGNLTFAHSELAGLQSWWAASEEGSRAARQVLAMMP